MNKKYFDFISIEKVCRLKDYKKVECIYVIHNIINNNIYIGQTTNLRNRIVDHKKCFKKGNHSCSLLQQDCKIYKKEIFKFYILERLEISLKERKEIEDNYIIYFRENFLNTLYNPITNKEHLTKLTTYTTEMKQKISEAVLSSEKYKKGWEARQLRGPTDKEKEQWARAAEIGARNSKECTQYDRKTGEKIKTYPSAIQAARETGFRQSSISLVCTGIMKGTGLYTWRYTKDGL